MMDENSFFNHHFNPKNFLFALRANELRTTARVQLCVASNFRARSRVYKRFCSLLVDCFQGDKALFIV